MFFMGVPEGEWNNLMLIGRSGEGARGARATPPPPPLSWVKNKMKRRKKKSRQGNQSLRRPPPPPLGPLPTSTRYLYYRLYDVTMATKTRFTSFQINCHNPQSLQNINAREELDQNLCLLIYFTRNVLFLRNGFP